MKSDAQRYRTIKGDRFTGIMTTNGLHVYEELKYLRKNYPGIKFVAEHYMDRSIIYAHEESWNRRGDDLP